MPLLVLLAACSLLPEVSHDAPNWEPLTPQIAPAPDDPLVLTASDGALGGNLTFLVAGGGYFDEVTIVRSSAGIGPGICPAVLGGACLGLLGPTEIMTSLWSDAEGNARLDYPLPLSPSLDGLEPCFQAVVILGPDGGATKLSEPVCSVFGRDSDEDGRIDDRDPCPDEPSDDCLGPEWVFADYEGPGTEFDPALMFNGTLSCSETCTVAGGEAVGARFVCNLRGALPTEGCNEENDGAYGEDNCGWMVRSGISLTENGNDEDCADPNMEACVSGTCVDTVTYHAIECQCEYAECIDRDFDGSCDTVDPCPDDPGDTCEATWVFADYDGERTEFDSDIPFDGTVTCADTCGRRGLEAHGARFVCNLHGADPTEGCDPDNDGMYGDSSCGWMVRNHVSGTENGNTEICALPNVEACVDGSCTESVRYHALQCQCH